MAQRSGRKATPAMPKTASVLVGHNVGNVFHEKLCLHCNITQCGSCGTEVGASCGCVQIKADSEGAGARSYNYRVIMMAGGAELDMRGRCSAGQKVRK